MIKITTTKGSFTGSLPEAAGWLEQHQPVGVTIEWSSDPVSVDLPEGDDADDWLCALESALGGELTDGSIRQLRSEATRAGDQSQIDLCDMALEGDLVARVACWRVIADADAQW